MDTANRYVLNPRFPALYREVSHKSAMKIAPDVFKFSVSHVGGWILPNVTFHIDGIKAIKQYFILKGRIR